MDIHLNTPLQLSKSKRREDVESLVQVVVAGMDPTCKEIETLHKDYENGIIFIMSAVEVGRIKSNICNLNCSTNGKFKNMLACQMDFGYNLALSSHGRCCVIELWV